MEANQPAVQDFSVEETRSYCGAKNKFRLNAESRRWSSFAVMKA
jgi:hypothetical protein